MNRITATDVTEAQALFTQLSKAPMPAAQLRQAVTGHSLAEKQVDLFAALHGKVTKAAEITAPVLADALKAAGTSIGEMRGKMGSCPVGGRAKPALPRD